MVRESKEADKCGTNFFNSNCTPKEKSERVTAAVMLALDQMLLFLGVGVGIRLLIRISRGKTLEDDDSFQDNEMK